LIRIRRILDSRNWNKEAKQKFICIMFGSFYGFCYGIWSFFQFWNFLELDFGWNMHWNVISAIYTMNTTSILDIGENLSQIDHETNKSKYLILFYFDFWHFFLRLHRNFLTFSSNSRISDILTLDYNRHYKLCLPNPG